MDFPARPEVKGDQKNRYRVEQSEKGESTRKNKGKWPAGYGWTQQRDGPQEHETLMSGAISARQKTPTDQEGERG